MRFILKVNYSWYKGSSAKYFPVLLSNCSELYSNHYGLWGDKASQAGQRIKLAPDRIKEWFEPSGSLIAIARIDTKLIGYSIAINEKTQYGNISWVTQLVVHEHYRHLGIGKNLLFAIWGLSDHFAWGILSSSPYAIRALEKATRRRCIPKKILANERKLTRFGQDNIFFFADKKIEITHKVSKCKTDFFANLSELDNMLSNVTSEKVPWLLGPLEEGWEWFAFTFQDQDQLELSHDEIKSILDLSDQITKIAYSRMQLTSSHLWTKHTDIEAKFIIEHCKLMTGETVLDIGCGIGRHSIALAKMGIKSTGVDYVEDLISAARNSAKKLETNQPQFIHGDFLDIKSEQKFDSVICVYDVIGSYTEKSDNLKLLTNIAAHLKPGGLALISVMNYELTKHKAKYFFSLKNDPNKLLGLSPSQTMARSGDIFDPNYYMIDTDNDIVYRKEQFLDSEALQAELIVRDKRFLKEEITQMCKSVGLKVLWTRYIAAGKWDISLNPTHNNAKEILLLCEKPTSTDTSTVEIQEQLF